MECCMIVLSLFDGMGCGYEALKRAGIPVTKYYASEIDNHAMKICMKNHPDVIQLGNVENWREWDIEKPDLIIGGSPCQGFSFAGEQLAFNDPRSALFFTMVDIINHYKPKYRFLENVKMKAEHLAVIDEMMGVKGMLINSALVSAQNRKRYYWFNWECEQPKERNILIRDIIDHSLLFDKSYSDYSPRETKNYIQFDVSGKGYNSQQDRAYYTHAKFGCIPNARAKTKIKITDCSGYYRDMTLTEVERLQTLTDGYTDVGHTDKSLCAIGNGWNIETIVHLFKSIPH